MMSSARARARVISDVHLELRKEHDVQFLIKSLQRFQENTPCKYLFMAGDIISSKEVSPYSPMPTAVSSFFQSLCDTYERIFYVLGNHEFYKNNIGIAATETAFKRYFSNEFPKIEVLAEDKVVLEDENTTVVGTTLWSEPTISAFCSMNDKNFVTHEAIIAKHKYLCRPFLEEAVREAALTKSKLVVMTHHLPSFDLIAPRYRTGLMSRCNSAFAAACDDLFVFEGKWIFGHTHTRTMERKNEIDFICNPLGYPGENIEYKFLLDEYDHTFDL
jgi:predicted phosphodiesterase